MVLGFFTALFFMTGCNGRTTSEEALSLARIAIDEGNFERGSLLLVRGGCEALHAQSVYLIHMANYRNHHDLMGMVRSWKGIYNLQPEEDFVQVAAYEFLNATFAQTIIINE